MAKSPPLHRPAHYRSQADRQRSYDETRPNARARGYTGMWERARKFFLSKNPLCVKCEEQGILTPANEVDHIIPHRGNQNLFWDQANWQSLCKSCHSKKTRKETNDRQ